MNDFPVISFVYEEEELDLEKITYLIREIESYNKQSKDYKTVVEFLDENLQLISNNMLCTRLWVLNDILHCVVLYPNREVRDFFETFMK